MNDNDKRSMKDRHSRDEADQRRLQQHSAGDGHSPVEAYPQHGAQPKSSRPAEALVHDYERTLALEQAAWESVKSAAQEADFAAAWHGWRAAVEQRDKATRGVINQSLAEETL
jgi:hypothetical protein